MLLDPGNPPARRTSNRRRAISRVRRSPECKKIWAAFIRDHPLCQFHFAVLLSKLPENEKFWLVNKAIEYTGTDARANIIEDLKVLKREDLAYLVVPTKNPHHPYITKAAEYCTQEVIAKCTPTCTRCHRAGHKGLKLCPRCGLNYTPWDVETCWPCYAKTHPDEIRAREKRTREWKETQKKLRCEARHKVQMRWLRSTLKEVLQRKIEGGEIQKGHINIDTESVIEFIAKTRNPATISPKRLHQMIGMWIESGCPRAKIFQR
jgi:hypothetical protein